MAGTSNRPSVLGFVQDVGDGRDPRIHVGVKVVESPISAVGLQPLHVDQNDSEGGNDLLLPNEQVQLVRNFNVVAPIGAGESRFNTLQTCQVQKFSLSPSRGTIPSTPRSPSSLTASPISERPY